MTPKVSQASSLPTQLPSAVETQSQKDKHKSSEPAFHWIESLSSIVLTVISSCSDISISKLHLYSSGVTLNPPLTPPPSIFPLCANCLHSCPSLSGLAVLYISGGLSPRANVCIPPVLILAPALLDYQRTNVRFAARKVATPCVKTG